MSNQDLAKLAAAKMAASLIPDECVLGVGSGSTVNIFIQELAKEKHKITAAIASSTKTKQLLEAHKIPVIHLNHASEIKLYIDGADAVDSFGGCIKGGGGALTQEKIIASVATSWICIVDESKVTSNLAKYNIAIEVIPCARSYVARELVKLNFCPTYRENFITDNHNIILDAKNLSSNINLTEMELTLNQIPGVVENGIFIKRKADKVIVGNTKEPYLLF